MSFKEHRLALNMTQAQLAEMFGVSSNTIARWERGEVKPEAPGMLALAIEALQMRMMLSNAELNEKRQRVKSNIERTLVTARRRIKHPISRNTKVPT